MTDAAPLRSPADSASQISGNIGDVLASIRRLIAQDEAAARDHAPAEGGPATLAAPDRQQPAPDDILYPRAEETADTRPLTGAGREAERPLILRTDELIRPLRAVPAPARQPSALADRAAAGGPAVSRFADAEPLRELVAEAGASFPEAQSRAPEIPELCPGFPPVPEAAAEEGANSWAGAADSGSLRREPAALSGPVSTGVAAARECPVPSPRPAALAPAAVLMRQASALPAAPLAESSSWTAAPEGAAGIGPSPADCGTRSKAQHIMTLAATGGESSSSHPFATSARDPAGGPLLRSLLRDLLRQELRGELGGDLGHYMRRMIRDEIALALTEAMERPA